MSSIKEGLLAAFYGIFSAPRIDLEEFIASEDCFISSIVHMLMLSKHHVLSTQSATPY